LEEFCNTFSLRLKSSQIYHLPIYKEAMNKTMNTGKVTFWSRKREKLWAKRETSGNFLEVRKIGSSV